MQLVAETFSPLTGFALPTYYLLMLQSRKPFPAAHVAVIVWSPMSRLACALALLLCQSLACAGVNPKNGNFYVTQLCDLLCKDTNRTYNSKSSERGWFGFGWGSRFETRLIVMTDSSAVILENGSGATRFYGRNRGTALADGIEQLITHVRAVRKLDLAEIEELRRKLQREDERPAIARKYGMGRDMPDNTVLVSDACETGNVARRGDMYVRTGCDGEKDTFDRRGWLVKHESKANSSLELEYGSGPYPIRIMSSAGCISDLEWNKAGAIVGIKTRRGDQAESSVLVYDQRGDLVRDTLSSGLIYRYAYDDKHNLTEVRYHDDTTLSIRYDENNFVTAQRQRTDEETRYEYGGDTSGQGPYWTKVTSFDASGAAFESRDYRWAAGGIPLRNYTSKGAWIEYEYDPVHQKVSRYRTALQDVLMQYDRNGHLIHVRDQNGLKAIWLKVDDQGLVRELKERRGRKAMRVLTIDYNQQRKATRLRLNGRQSIRIQYDRLGEIHKVHSASGIKAGMMVMQMMQSLKAMLDPSGLDVGW